MTIIDVESNGFHHRKVAMNVVLPSRYDMVSFSYHGREFSGEVRRVYDKPKGHLIVVKLSEGKYRSCYFEQMENFKVEPQITFY